MILLNVPILGQRDNRWASQRLGTVDGTTIGGYGCLITCISMLASYYGHATTPDVEDNWLTDNKGYAQGNMYRWDAFPREFTDCTYDSAVACVDIPAPLSQIDSSLNVGKPVVVEVDFDHDTTDGIQTHFVLIVGKNDNGHYICNDPWYNDQIDFNSRYGDNAAQDILQINFFSGPVPQPKQVANIIPGYLITLLQEHQLDITNEDQIRKFFQKAIDFDSALNDKNSAQARITDLEAANRIQADVIAQKDADIAALNSKINQPVSTPVVAGTGQNTIPSVTMPEQLDNWLRRIAKYFHLG